jgi:hypothetical protein
MHPKFRKSLAFAFAGGSAFLFACAAHDDTKFPNLPQPTETPPVRTIIFDSGVATLDDSGEGQITGAYPEVGYPSTGDAPLVQDTARDLPVDPGAVRPDGQDARMVDAPMLDGADAAREVPAELPPMIVDAGIDATEPDGGLASSGGSTGSGGTSSGSGGTTSGSGGLASSGGSTGSGGTSTGSGGTTSGSGGMSAPAVWACAYSGCVNNAGIYSVGGGVDVGTYGTVEDASGKPLAAGALLQYIYVGSDGFINDPNSDGTVRAADNLVGSGHNYYVGDDSDTCSTFTGTAGKFFHQICELVAGAVAGADQFYVRVWDRDPSDPAALFGDSDVFSPAVGADLPPLPKMIGLASFYVHLDKAAPRTPVPNDPTGISASPPSATLNWYSYPGARYYLYQVALSSDSTYDNPVADGTVYYNSSRHAASSFAQVSVAITLEDYGQDYRFRIKAGNDFGESAWVEGAGFYVPLPMP